jgi:hypothetical protein
MTSFHSKTLFQTKVERFVAASERAGSDARLGAEIALAVQLGARPPKRASVNYKQLKQEQQLLAATGNGTRSKGALRTSLSSSKAGSRVQKRRDKKRGGKLARPKKGVKRR